VQEKTPITLITGPLGSGKTTLLRRILDGADRRLAVVMNEFGELAVDSRVIEGKNFSFVELVGGCVCCSLAGELNAAVRDLVSTVEETVDVARLDCVACIVDAYADLVIINKIDLVTPEEFDIVRRRVSAEAGKRGGDPEREPLVVETERCGIELPLLFGAPRTVRAVSGEHLRHTPAVQAFTVSTECRLDRSRFLEFLSALPQEVFRAKGFVRFAAEGEWLFNYVAGRADFEDFPTDRTELVFIGPGVDGVRAEILAGFRACEA
jgi:G3E family GTPase